MQVKRKKEYKKLKKEFQVRREEKIKTHRGGQPHLLR